MCTFKSQRGFIFKSDGIMNYITI